MKNHLIAFAFLLTVVSSGVASAAVPPTDSLIREFYDLTQIQDSNQGTSEADWKIRLDASDRKLEILELIRDAEGPGVDIKVDLKTGSAQIINGSNVKTYQVDASKSQQSASNPSQTSSNSSQTSSNGSQTSSNSSSKPMTSVSTGTIKLENPLKGVDSIGDFVYLVINFVYSLSYAVIAIFLIISGFKFVAAQGKPEALDDAKKTFKYTIIGAILLIAASVITEVVKTVIYKFVNV
jgi:hypothetical protein